MKKHKEKWHFSVANDLRISLKYPKMVNIEFLSFHMEEHIFWFTFLGFGIVAQRY